MLMILTPSGDKIENRCWVMSDDSDDQLFSGKQDRVDAAVVDDNKRFNS